jgi:hypothetical protein
VGDIVHRITQLFHGVGWIWLATISVVLAMGSLALAAVVVVAWAPDRFKDATRPALREAQHPVLRVLAVIGRNLLGLVLVVLGVIMSLPGVPGQGVLVILIGLTLADFPGKRRMELWLLRRPSLFRAINSLRARFHKPALELD